jgi:hypothetical protein
MSEFLFGAYRPKTKTINIIFMNGGVGDLIAAFTPVDYILKRYPWITPLIWVPDVVLDIGKNLLPEHAQIFSYSEMKGRYDPSKITKTTEWDGHISPMKIHPVDYAFLKLCDEIPSIEEKNYLRIRPGDVSKFNLPKKFIVMTTGFTADVREFRPEFVNEITKYAISKGYAVVFLGQKEAKTGSAHVIAARFKDGIDFKAGIDLVGKTSLSEACWIMERASAVLGVDNGLLHVAGCTDVPIVGGFTTVSPKIRMPIRHNQLGYAFHAITPDESLECRYCQEDTNFLYGHDYKTCLFNGIPGAWDRVNACTRQMTAEKFISHMESVL